MIFFKKQQSILHFENTRRHIQTNESIVAGDWSCHFVHGFPCLQENGELLSPSSFWALQLHTPSKKLHSLLPLGLGTCWCCSFCKGLHPNSHLSSELSLDNSSLLPCAPPVLWAAPTALTGDWNLESPVRQPSGHKVTLGNVCEWRSHQVREDTKIYT